jgi:hypothetical protein
VTLGRQVDLKLVTGSGEAFRLPALVTVFWDFTSTHSRLNQSGDEKTTVHLASKASHGCSDSHTHRVHCNAFLLTCLRNTIITLAPLVLGTTSLSDEETVSCLSVGRTPVLQPESAKATVIFFRFALLPTDAKHQRSNRINQKKENHSQTNKRKRISHSQSFHAFHPRLCIGQLIGRSTEGEEQLSSDPTGSM